MSLVDRIKRAFIIKKNEDAIRFYLKLKQNIFDILSGWRFRVMITEPDLENERIHAENNQTKQFINMYCCFSNWRGTQTLIESMLHTFGNNAEETLRIEPITNLKRIPLQEIGLAAFFGRPKFLEWIEPTHLENAKIRKIGRFLKENNASAELQDTWKNLGIYLRNISKYTILGHSINGNKIPDIIRVYYPNNIFIYLPLTRFLDKLHFSPNLVLYIDNVNTEDIYTKKVFYFFDETSNPHLNLFENPLNDNKISTLINKIQGFSRIFVNYYERNLLPKVRIEWQPI
ncbi:MAG: hypothetical protein ACTSRZ_15655 [Promethearchaeota archaeon]